MFDLQLAWGTNMYHSRFEFQQNKTFWKYGLHPTDLAYDIILKINQDRVLYDISFLSYDKKLHKRYL